MKKATTGTKRDNQRAISQFFSGRSRIMVRYEVTNNRSEERSGDSTRTQLRVRARIAVLEKKSNFVVNNSQAYSANVRANQQTKPESFYIKAH